MMFDGTAFDGLPTNGERRMLLRVAVAGSTGLAGLDAPPATARTAQRLVDSGHVRRDGVQYFLTETGRTWICDAFNAGLPDQASAGTQERLMWQKAVDSLV